MLLGSTSAAAVTSFQGPGFAATSSDARQRLLEAVAAKKGDSAVIPALRELAKSNPTPKPARSEILYGKWKLLWASDNSEVSIATRR